MFEWIKSTFTKFFAWLDSIVQWFYDLVIEVFAAIWDIMKDAVCWVLESLLDVVLWLIEQLDLSGLTGYASAWGGLPDEITNVMGLLGVGDAAAIIIAAILIRLVMQLIPFTRLGS